MPPDTNPEKNDKPAINVWTPAVDVVVGQTLTVPIEAYDHEDDTILIKALSKPKGSALTPDTADQQNGAATFTWAPTDKQANRKYKVKFRAEETKDNDVKPHLKSELVTTEIRVFPQGSEESANLMIHKAQWQRSKSQVVVSGKVSTWKLLDEEERDHLVDHATLTVNGTAAEWGKNGNWSATLTGLSETSVPCKVTATLQVHSATITSDRDVKRAPSSCTK